MFERIISITKNYAIVKISNNINTDILNFNVIIYDGKHSILGEIEEIIDTNAKISFLGEFINGKFFNGIINRPSLVSKIRIINQVELSELVGDNDQHSMVLGLSPFYNNYPIKVNIDEFFSNHMAIFGNTGSGKTCGVSRIFQNFFTMKDKLPVNSNIIIFNNTSEYDSAFKDVNKVNSNFNYKLFTTDKEDATGYQIALPLWILDVDDWANILDITDYFQINIIEKMMSYVSIFARNDEYSSKFKNNLIAKAIISILYSNLTPSKIRDLIFNILKDCYTPELNLDAEVPGIGYTREFRSCFDLDKEGEFVERVLVTKYIQSFVDNNTVWNEDYVPVYFDLNQLEIALNFTLISEGFILNDKSYNEAVALKVKLHSINSTYKKEFFNVPNFITKESYINSLFVTRDNKRAQILNFVLEDVDDRFAKSIVKVYSRILFKFAKSLSPRGSMPIHLMLEEAHRYVQKDSDINILGYNIFDRIAKEGRKFGFIMDVISQRPTELSETVLSQCSNFIIFKLNHPSDLEYIKLMVPNISEDVVEKQKTLQSGTCVAFGKMMKIPMIVKMQMPNPAPQSSNASVYDKWIINNQS